MSYEVSLETIHLPFLRKLKAQGSGGLQGPQKEWRSSETLSEVRRSMLPL